MALLVFSISRSRSLAFASSSLSLSISARSPSLRARLSIWVFSCVHAILESALNINGGMVLGRQNQEGCIRGVLTLLIISGQAENGSPAGAYGFRPLRMRG